MKCPHCGTELERKMTYCPECGGRLKQEDNSKDDTLRLPDLSDVPLGGQPKARKTPPRRKKEKSNAAIVAAVVVVIAAAAAAALYIYFSRGAASPLGEPPVTNEGAPAAPEENDSPDINVPNIQIEIPSNDEPALEDVENENGEGFDEGRLNGEIADEGEDGPKASLDEDEADESQNNDENDKNNEESNDENNGEPESTSESYSVSVPE